jgi:hypothetical protein
MPECAGAAFFDTDSYAYTCRDGCWSSVRRPAATATCTMNFQAEADTRDMINVVANAHAGTWHIAAFATGKDRAHTAVYDYATTKVQRASKLTVNASPEPVKKGKKITVTGALTRANWNTRAWAGYSGQSIKLQYRP